MPQLFKALGLIVCALGLSGFTTQPVSFDNVQVFPETPPASLRGLLAKPEGNGKFPAVVLWHTCAGVQEHVLTFWPEYLTGLGYVTLTLDSFGPRGQTNCLKPVHLLAGPNGANRRITAGDPHGALRYLASLSYVDSQRVALMGFSYGGIMVAYLSNLDLKTPEGLTFKALVSFYGHCSKGAPDRPALYPGGDPRYPWLILIGEKEAPGFRTSCAAMAGRPGVTFKILPDAHHAWDSAKATRATDDGVGNVMLYSREATEASQRILKEYLDVNLAR
ncbi:MAG: dienelactone hydrolase family protein [Rhodospirillaceae bacterium]|nr:dienelactone hydrolase family protein [Rhodospirillaceae bacterium]